MTEFTHTYKSVSDCASKFVPNNDVDFTLVLYKADGTVSTVDSNECPAYKDEERAISAAMFSVKNHDDECDVYHFGELYGTAEYVNLNPDSFFSTEQVVFSQPC